MQTLILVRPGATEFDQQGRIQGTLDIPLCQDGRRQCATTLSELHGIDPAINPVAIYASPCQSAQETAGLLAHELGLKVKVIDKLHNLDHGLWQGMLVEEVRLKQPKVYRQWQDHPETVCPPEGETVLNAKKRAAEALQKMFKKHKDKSETIVLVSPEPFASLVRHVLMQDKLGDFWKTAEGCGAWETIEVPEEVTA